MPTPFTDFNVGLTERFVDFSAVLSLQIVAPLLVDERRVTQHRFLRIKHRRQRFVAHFDQFGPEVSLEKIVIGSKKAASATSHP